MTPQGFLSNQAGGTLGGISSGQDLLVSMAVKPTSSITRPGRSIDVAGQPVEIVTTGRHDPCVGLRAVPIAEAMLALVLADHYLRHRAQNAEVRSSHAGDHLSARRRRWVLSAEVWNTSGIREAKGLQRRLQPRSSWVRVRPWAIVMSNSLSIRERERSGGSAPGRTLTSDRWESR